MKVGMSKPGDALRRLIGRCAALARAEVSLDPALRATIEGTLARMMRALATLQAAATGKRVASAPGYIDCDRVLVPFYLLEDIPSPSVLAELAALGCELRLSNDGVICLSGSTVLLGSLEFVGDLDFCEYASCDPARGAASLVAAIDAHAQRSDAPLCQRVKVFEPSYSVTCPDEWHATGLPRVTALIADGANHLKLDFVARTATAGVLEATNVVLLLSGQGDDDKAIAKSFAAQEVPIGSDSIVLPRQLTDPLQLGHYINFLCHQTEHYVGLAPVKALKRALSLTRILLLEAHDDAIVSLLRDTQGALAAAIDARQELIAQLATLQCASPVRAAALAQLQSDLRVSLTRLQAEAEGTLRTTWRDEATSCVNRLISDVKPLIAVGSVS